MADAENPQLQKVRKIFAHFDKNQDGWLSREEMGALVVAVNPRVRFTEHHVKGILDEVFRTYSDFINGPAGLSFEGLLRTYEDGAGDVDRDFDALKLTLDESGDEASRKAAAASSIMDERADSAAHVRRKEHMPSWAASNMAFDSSWLLVDDLLIIIRRLETKLANKLREAKGSGSTDGSSEVPWSSDLSVAIGSGGNGRRPWEELGQDYANFQRELSDIIQKANKLASVDEVFDAQLAIGRTLFDHLLVKEAVPSLRKAVELRGTDARPHFHLANALYCLGNYADARESYAAAIGLASGGEDSSQLLPHIHTNLGITLEGEGMLLSAAEQYKEAAKLLPKSHRVRKLLGSALYGVGDLRAAENALRDSIALKPDFEDAHCDLGSTLHAIGEDNEEAIHEFQKALDIKPDHMEALYNLAGLFKDIGRYQRSAEMYSKVLALQPMHWRAQLNRAVALLGAQEREEANKSLKEAFKMTKRVELYDALAHMKLLAKKHKGISTTPKAAEDGVAAGERVAIGGSDGSVLVVEPSHFQRASDKTTPRQWLTSALEIRRFQRDSRLNRCDVVDLKKEFINSTQAAESSTGDDNAPCTIYKHELEKILRKLLHFLNSDTFQGAVKAINKKVFHVLDQTGNGQIDLCLFFAIIAPICSGSPDKRKQVAFDALAWRVSRRNSSGVLKVDASHYMRLLRQIYLSGQGVSDLMELHGEDDRSTINFTEFLGLFDDPDWGFGILGVLLKLEASDRVRHGSQTCAICSYRITGPWFKEVTAHFSLCCLCYSEGKVPLSAKREDYCFKEYNGGVEAVKDKLRIFSSRSSRTPSIA